jgi:hypothetical protein
MAASTIALVQRLGLALRVRFEEAPAVAGQFDAEIGVGLGAAVAAQRFHYERALAELRVDDECPVSGF